jgi:recombination protein RecA
VPPRKASGVHPESSLAVALATIDRTYGKGAVMDLGDEKAIGPVASISTGSFALDRATGVGGLPRGRIIEIFGPESSGKTTLALSVCAQAHRDGGICAFIDAEHALQPEYAAAIGVSLEKGRMLISQPDCGEQGLEIADILIRSGQIDVVVIDSVAALVPQAELDGSMADMQVGLQARLMSKGLRKLAGGFTGNRAVCIFINQLREKVGVLFGSPETTPGGKALKFYSSVRLDVRKTETLRDGSEAIGNRLRVKVVKNKVARPFRQAEFDLVFAKGINRAAELVDFGITYELIRKRGSFYYAGDTLLGQGRAAAAAVLAERPDAARILEAELLEAMRELPAPEAGTGAETEPEAGRGLLEPVPEAPNPFAVS